MQTSENNKLKTYFACIWHFPQVHWLVGIHWAFTLQLARTLTTRIYYLLIRNLALAERPYYQTILPQISLCFPKGRRGRALRRPQRQHLFLPSTPQQQELNRSFSRSFEFYRRLELSTLKMTSPSSMIYFSTWSWLIASKTLCSDALGHISQVDQGGAEGKAVTL